MVGVKFFVGVEGRVESESGWSVVRGEIATSVGA